jgi:hypothetical protein
MANIVLQVKPIEAVFAHTECGADVARTSGVLFTNNGIPQDPVKMASILSTTFSEYELEINFAALRHGLEAFAHKFPRPDSGYDRNLVAQANHGVGTSARYGRDENCFVGIPADISEANFVACHNWNMVVLDSPSMISDQVQALLNEQLQELGLMSSQPSARAGMLKSPGSSERTFTQFQDGDMSQKLYQAGSREHVGCTVQPGCAMTQQPQAQSKHATGLHDQVQHIELATKAERISQPTQPGKHQRTPDQIEQNRLEAEKRLKAASTPRPMQLEALQFLEQTNSSAFVIMPTASGKTALIFYHRKRTNCSIIFAPYNLLCLQLLSVCKEKGVAEAWPFEAFNGSADALLLNLEFAIFPYEAATQAHTFIGALHGKGRLGPIWVDEVSHAQPIE